MYNTLWLRALLHHSPSLICVPQIQEDAYQDDLGFSTGQLGKSGMSGSVRAPNADKKTQVSISKRLQVHIETFAGGHVWKIVALTYIHACYMYVINRSQRCMYIFCMCL